MEPEVLEEAKLFIDQNPRAELRRVTQPDGSTLDWDLSTVPSALRTDISAWVELLATITGAARVGLRLICLTSAMCPKFHADNITLRLVTTYTGPCTELLEGASLEPQAAEGPGGLPPHSTHVTRATPGDIVLLKGHAWPGNDGRGAVHRSPIATPDNPRLVLTLDALDA